MLRAFVLAASLASAFAACHKDTDPPPMHPKDGELPPLPPSSGTAVGYLLDNASQLSLNDDQLGKLKEIDASLSARNASIDTQLRIIEKPEEDPPASEGGPPVRHNNAPGAQVRTTPDAAKLHAARKENDWDALTRAFALLGPEQQATARKLLEDRGITAPGSRTRPAPRPQTDDGAPVDN